MMGLFADMETLGFAEGGGIDKGESFVAGIEDDGQIRSGESGAGQEESETEVTHIVLERGALLNVAESAVRE